MNQSKRKLSLGEYRTLLPYFHRFKFRYALGFFFLLTVDAAQVLIPQFMRSAVDTISSGIFSVRDIIPPALTMIGLMAIITIGRFSWRYFIHGSSRKIEADLRKNLFEHLLLLSYTFYQKNKIGDLMARATHDLNAIRESIGMGLVALVDGTVMASAILVIIFIQDTKTAAWAVLPLPLITILIFFFGKAIGKRFRQAHEAYSALSDAVQETFAGIRVVKSFVKEWWFVKKFADTNDRYRDTNMALVRLFGFFFPFVNFLSGVTILIVLLVGGIRVTQGLMTPGDLVALFRYLQMLIWPLIGAGWVVNMIQRGAVSLGRVNEIMKTVPDIRSPTSPKKIMANNNNFPLIELRNFSFAFETQLDTSMPSHTAETSVNEALHGINLTIERGSITGILGRTGSGKSTLVKAIIRMVDPPPDTVFIKGIASSMWDLQELRKLFAVIPQDSYLFSDSIKNNIAYSLDHEDEAVLKKAAAIAALEKDLCNFSGGWDTPIGERGLTLSGGQKQRVAIARSVAAVLADDREILVLDDSLSAVDTETEQIILDGLFELHEAQKHKGKPLTIIIVSHRVSTLNRASGVLVLAKGRIIESGAPSDLASSGGFYARTSALQRLGAEVSCTGGGNG